MEKNVPAERDITIEKVFFIPAFLSFLFLVITRECNNIYSYINLPKTFDTVDQFVLLQKLEHYGIKGRNLS